MVTFLNAKAAETDFNTNRVYTEKAFIPTEDLVKLRRELDELLKDGTAANALDAPVHTVRDVMDLLRKFYRGGGGAGSVVSLTDNLDGTFTLTVNGNPTTYNVLAYADAGATSLDELSDAQNDSVNQNLIVGSNGFSGTFFNNRNTAVGVSALLTPNTDNSNIAFGDANTAVGFSALTANTTGLNNVAVGSLSLSGNTSGASNMALGTLSMSMNTTGAANVAVGTTALDRNTTGNFNTAVGFQAGQFIADGVTNNTSSDLCVLVGQSCRTSTNNDQNAIVIGSTAIGAGSNTVVLGNTSIVSTFLKGVVTATSFLSSVVTGYIGYTTGAGGVVTQATSKSTGVTLNTPAGTITTNAASLAANTAVTFTVTNSRIAATDCVCLSIRAAGATAGAYDVIAGSVAAGSFAITILNMTAGALAEALQINFATIAGAIS